MIRIWPNGDPRTVARAILSDPRYAPRQSAGPAPASWWDGVWAWIAGLLRDVLHGIDRALGAHNPYEAAIGFAVLAASALLVGAGGVVLVRRFVRAPRRSIDRSGGVAPGAAGEGRSRDLRAAAVAAAGARRYREAVALLFLAALRALDERGRLTYDPALTPGDYRRLVRDPIFDALAGDTVVALFAAAEPTGELFERMSGNFDRFFAAPP